MTKDLKIDFENLTLDSIADDSLNHGEVENIEIDLDMFNYGVDGEHDYAIHGKDIDLKKIQVFNNLQYLSIIQKKNNENLGIYLDLDYLLKIPSLKKVYLEGHGLFPMGLSSDQHGKGNFIVETKNLQPAVRRLAQLQPTMKQITETEIDEGFDFYKDKKKLTFDGSNLSYFDKIDFNELFENKNFDIFYDAFGELYTDRVEEIIIQNLGFKDQFDNGKIIDLSPLSKFKNIKEFLIYYFDYNPQNNPIPKYGPIFNFDNFPIFQKLEYLQIAGNVHNYDFIKNLKQLKELIIDHNWIDDPKFFSTKEIKPLSNLRKITISYPETSLITDLSHNHKSFPNLEELSLQGLYSQSDNYAVDPLEIIVFKNLKILRMHNSTFSSKEDAQELGEYNEALEWCLKRLKKNDK